MISVQGLDVNEDQDESEVGMTLNPRATINRKNEKKSKGGGCAC